MSLITEAREKGFVRGAVIQIKGDIRVMTSGRIVEFNGNLQVMCQSPFFIRWRGEWCAEVLKKNTKSPNNNSYDYHQQKRKIHCRA